ncbi:unnamed protein product [Fraxinus pennsylvanica]|uniref:CYTH domain-containing protein n=1 Tax=Fraxinus pennsylvanica TaxID=56036 RepID=A0AAD1YQM9_9LAMI|nr:unnamed protein product [Fraxinus pennsylvanica]
MEIEVKLRLTNKASHQKLLQLLSPFYITTHRQHNTFFDGTGSQLSSRRAVLRLRFHEQTDIPKCFVCLKAKAVITNGVSRVEEDEEEVDPSIGYACLEDPRKLMDVDSRVLRRVKEEFGVNGFKGLGGFRTVRSVYEWNGVKLEVDEVKYEFGDLISHVKVCNFPCRKVAFLVIWLDDFSEAGGRGLINQGSFLTDKFSKTYMDLKSNNNLVFSGYFVWPFRPMNC